MKQFNNIKGLATLVVLLTASFGLSAQNTITGKVTDAGDGTEIPGVNIQIEGTSSGTTTDFNGDYRLQVEQGNVLIFSFVGYANKSVTVGSETVLDVQLELDVQQLEEIVVVGYGQQEKGDVTGVVAAVNEETFNRGAIVSPDQLITGKVAGVQITTNSAEPGGQTSIRIRGGTSVNASNEPLYVIDGVPIDNTAHNPGGFATGRNPLNFLNPNDIETFTVLKDASATAIYGSRGANGVILITTKKGKAGETKISYNGWFSVAEAFDKVDVLNGDEYRQVVAERAPNRLTEVLNANTDWQAKILQQAVGHNHALGISGGQGDLGYRLSLGYLQQEGIVRRTETERTSLALNVNNKMLGETLTLDVNLKGSMTNDVFNDAGVIGDAVGFAPTQPVFDAQSPWAGYWEWPRSFGTALSNNPVSNINQTQDEGETFRSVGNVKFDYDVPWVEGLTATLNLGYDVTRGERKRFLPNTLRTQATDSGEVRRENVTRLNQLIDAYLFYQRNLDAITGKFDVQFGYSYQDFRNEFPGFRAFTLSSNFFGFDNPAPASQFETTNSVQENRIISFFGRTNFHLQDKYLLTVTVRRDGSSRFGPDNRWGWFPSVAAGWRILDEDFMNFATSFVSDLKLRVGWGITGNQDFANNQFQSLFRPGDQFSRPQFGGAFPFTFRPSGADPGLKWEETTQTNVGLDAGFLDGRLTANLDVYWKTTQDLLFRVAVPAGTNLTDQIITNIGEVDNQGVELGLNAVVIDRDKISWDLGFNIAYNRNEIKLLDGNTEADFPGIPTGSIAGGVGNKIQVLRVGEQVNSFWTLRHRLDDNGRPVTDADGRTDLDLYEDINGDGIINELDRVINDAPAPDVIMGLTSTLYAYNFDLAFTMRGNFGNKVYNNVSSNRGNFRGLEDITLNNLHRSALTNQFNDRQLFSDIYIEDASFVRMDNITLGYTVPDVPGNIGVRLYATMQNVFLITDYSGLDPEIGNPANQSGIDDAAFGIDNNVFPQARTILFGANIDF